MNVAGLLGLFCGVAVLLAGLLATYFVWIHPHQHRANQLLGLLFLSIALRIGKSIGYFILYGVAELWVAVGFVGLASTGPLLWAYVRAQTGHALTRPSLWHGLIPLAGTVAIALPLPLPDSLLYKGATLLLLGYLVACGLWLRQHSQGPKAYPWETRLLAGMGLVWAAYGVQHLAGSMQGYAWGAALAALPLYMLLVRVVKEGLVVKPKRATTPAEAVPAPLVQQVRRALETEQAYRQRNLTLNQFASHIAVPAYRVTQAVQHSYAKSFPETLNALRVQAAQAQLLADPEAFIKMEVLAREVGFNSPSAFYAAFKKETGHTPKAYQKAQRAARPVAIAPY